MARTASRASFDLPDDHRFFLTELYESKYKGDGKTTEGAPSLSEFFELQYVEAFSNQHSKALAGVAEKAARARYLKHQSALAQAEAAAEKARQEAEQFNAVLEELGLDPTEFETEAE